MHGRSVLGLMVVAIAALLPLGASAQTPETSAVLVDGAQRQFETPGLRLIGPGAISVTVYRAASADAAAAGLSALVEQTVDRIGGDTIQPASAPKLGDERIARAGTMTSEGNTFAVGLFAWRDGAFIYLTIAAGLSGDQLQPLFDLARTLEDREATDDVWQRLPSLDDMPEGFVLTDEQSLAPATPEP